MSDSRTSVLFVCLGNICRSPLAEGVFLHLAQQRDAAARFDVDSCGTGGWHAGERPDPRSLAVAEKFGVTLPGRARKYEPRTDNAFDWLIPMDASNRDDLIESGAPRERVRLLRSFDPLLAGMPERSLDVPDPYYGAAGGFDEVYEMIHRACTGMLDELESKRRDAR